MVRRLFRTILLLFLCGVIVVECLQSEVIAYERKDHDKYMLEALFKNFKEVDNDPGITEKLEALESASYLCIDQFNSKGQRDLDKLLHFGVKGIPKNINEISFDAWGTTHRSYTHRGWRSTNNSLPTEKRELREQILLNTADAVFDFAGNEKQKESFCALIYYIHLLGDHMDDSSYKVNNGLKMEVGGRKDKTDIIHELETHIAVVFSDQSHTHKYQSLMASLEKYNSRFYKLINSEGGINTDEKFAEKQEYVEGLTKLLTYYLPEMLKDEPFFYQAFYE